MTRCVRGLADCVERGEGLRWFLLQPTDAAAKVPFGRKKRDMDNFLEELKRSLLLPFSLAA